MGVLKFLDLQIIGVLFVVQKPNTNCKPCSGLPFVFDSGGCGFGRMIAASCQI